MAAEPIRVVIADDQALVRAGFRMILATQPDMAVLAEAANGQEAVAACQQAQVDVVLMDIRMPVMDGLEATRRLLSNSQAAPPRLRVLILTTFDLDEYVYAALQAGASGFLLKDVSPEQLIAGVRSVAAGDALLTPGITRRLIERFARPTAALPGAPEKLAQLTPRELEIFKRMAAAMSNAEIAAALVLSEATVKTHVARSLAKLQLRDRVQAVVFAYESGLVAAGGHKNNLTAESAESAEKNKTPKG
jgi:DNA-binding NarL/FixJ family response regulator